MKNAIVYACYLVNSWQTIVSEQLDRIFSSLTVLKGGEVFICASGKEEEYFKLLQLVNGRKAQISFHQDTRFSCEAYGLLKIYELSESNYDYVGYLHAKGVTKLNKSEHVESCIENWRKCMEYYVLDKSETCIQSMHISNKNCAGVMFDCLQLFHNKLTHFEFFVSKYHNFIFPGNFFWVKCSWFRQQEKPVLTEDYFYYERFIGYCKGVNPYYLWIRKYSGFGGHMMYVEKINESEYKRIT